jgi:hypothetical protein
MRVSGRELSRVTGRALQCCGLGLVILAVAIAVQLIPAYGQVPAAHATPIPSVLPTLSPTPLPTATPRPGPTATAGPTPTPLPTSQPKHFRGGKLHFNLIGDLSLGENSSSSTFGSNGFFNSPNPSPGTTASPSPTLSTSQSQAIFGAGASAELSRRSATTYTDIRVPLAFSGNGRSTFGVPSMLYSTPTYSLGYGPQVFNALGQLQIGQTQRGFELIRPAGNGQVTFYQGPSIGVDGETLRVDGMLLQQLRGGKFYEFGLLSGRGELTGSVKTLLFGIATVHRTTDFTGEGAYQIHTGGVLADSHGLAAQMRFDDTVNAGACSVTLRTLPENFVIFGGGAVPSDRFLDLGCHATKIPIYADTSWERTGSSGVVSEQRLVSIGYAPSFRNGGISLNLQRQSGSSGDVTIASTAASLSLSTQIFGAGALIGATTQRTVQGGDTHETRSILASLHRELGNFNIGVNAQVQTQLQVASPVSEGLTPAPQGTPVVGIQRGLGISIARSFRRTTFQFGETITHSVTASSDATQITPLFNITRQLSPALSIQTSLGYQILNDRLNPTASGRTRVFAISLSAPFAFGNGLVTGRVDPHLPATIVGRVVISAGGSGQGPALNIGTLGGSGGVGNVIVSLDGNTAQRTDLTGGFQFPFVPAGQHTISISAATLPRGFTAASPVQTVLVRGGQQADITFAVSTLGGIFGHVYGSAASGVPLPLAEVRLQVDGGAYAQTDASGQYGFGGLSPGMHEVTIIPQTVPATADFSTEDLKGKISVSNGIYSTLDFHAQVLGSISGQILLAKDMSKEEVGGVPNAYVVAEPGEHAAIDEDDGSFVIDNLPPGNYTVSVDPESIDPALGASPSSVSVHLGPGEQYKGILFSVGHLEKKVVFSLLGGSATPAPTTPQVRLRESSLPPRGSTEVTIDAPSSESDVAVSVMGKRFALAYDKGRSKWVGLIEVPATAKSGSYTVEGAAGKASPKSATLVVDPKLPLALVTYTPRDAGEGQNVTVRVRFLVNARPGDRITWQDGTETILGKPLTGRVFTFTKRLTLLPLHGTLLTQAGSLPIELL